MLNNFVLLTPVFSLFNSFLMSKGFVLFDLIVLLKLVTLVSKSVLFPKISCFILAATIFAVDALTS